MSGGIQPLTPAATKSGDGQLRTPHGSGTNLAGGYQPAITPQRSPGQDRWGKSGRSSGSVPASRDVSPGGTPASNSGANSPYIVPVEDANERYARSQRAMQGFDPKTLASKRQNSTLGDSTSHRSSSASLEQKEVKSHGIFGSKRHHVEEDHHEKKGSMQDLKRFFHIGGNKHKDKADSDSRKSTKSMVKSGMQTPPQAQSRHASMAVPFADDHGLQSKYGKFGKV